MTKFLIPIVVGAIIGYITNWLAIKMLFRPYMEKRFLGIKVPFTPGLIPKERERIAKSIGDTVGNHLLTPEMIISSLNNDDVSEQIGKFIDEKIESLKNSDLTIGDWLESFTGEYYDSTIKTMESALSQFAVRELKKEDNKIKIGEVLKDIIYREEILKSNLYLSFRGKLEEVICNPQFENETQGFIESMITSYLDKAEKTDALIKDIIPPTLSNASKVYIYNHKQEITDLLRDILNDERVHEKLKGSIATLIELNFGKLVTMFMNPENIAIKVIVAVMNYINKPENQENIALIGVKFIDTLLDKKTSEILNEIPAETKKEIITQGASSIVKAISSKDNQVLLINTIEDNIKKNEICIKEYAVDGVLNMLNGFLSSELLKTNIKLLTQKSLASVLKIKFESILQTFDGNSTSSIKTIILSILRNLIKNKAGYFADLLKVQKIVEDRINSFDVEFAEKLILDVARKELSAITWLGALLGAIMGIISPLIQLVL